MASNIEELPLLPINGVRPLVAARLCNFPTGSADLQPSHVRWCEGTLIPAIESANGPWLDVCGYASRRGSPHYPNLALSERRENAVKWYVAGRAPQCAFNLSTAYGSARSTGGPTDNEGYWRAVDIHVFGERPPHAVSDTRPRRPPAVGPLPWMVTNLSSSFSASYYEYAGCSLFTGRITFAQSHEPQPSDVTRGIHFAGGGIGGGTGPNVYGALGSRLAGRLFSGVGMAVAHAAIAQAERIAGNLIGGLLGNAATNIWNLIPVVSTSRTQGYCYPIHRPFLAAEDFSGAVAIFALSADGFVGSVAHYAMFFGLQRSFFFREIPLAVEAGAMAPHVLAAAIIRECRGFTFIVSGGFSAVLSAGVSASAMIGWID